MEQMGYVHDIPLKSHTKKHLNASNDRGEQQRLGLDATDHAVGCATGYTYHDW